MKKGLYLFSSSVPKNEIVIPTTRSDIFFIMGNGDGDDLLLAVAFPWAKEFSIRIPDIYIALHICG